MKAEKKKTMRAGASKRKVAEPQKAGHKFKVSPLFKVSGLLILVVMLFQGGSVLLQTQDTAITNVQVNGQLKQIDGAKIKSWLRDNLEQGMLRVNLEEVQAHIKANPWVNHVSVRRHWPNTLQIEIVEHVPMARWNKAGLITKSAQTIEVEEVLDSFKLPDLSGPTGSEVEVWNKYLWINQILGELDLSVARLTKEERGAWHLSLQQNPKTSIYLGRHELEQRLTRFKALYQRVLSQRFNEVVQVDLRYTNGAAVKWLASKKVG